MGRGRGRGGLNVGSMASSANQGQYSGNGYHLFKKKSHLFLIQTIKRHPLKEMGRWYCDFQAWLHIQIN